MRISLSRSPKIIEARLPLPLRPFGATKEITLESERMHRAHPARSKVIQSSGRSGWRPADFARTHRPGSLPRTPTHAEKSEMSTYLPHVQRPRELELAPVLPAGLGAGSGSASEIVRRNVVKRLEKKRPGPCIRRGRASCTNAQETRVRGRTRARNTR